MKPEWETAVQCGLKTLVPTGKCWVLYAGDPEEAREAALETANRLCNGKSEPEGWNRPKEDIDRADVFHVFGELFPSPNDRVYESRFGSYVMDINDDWFLGPDLVYFIAAMDASRAEKLPQEGFLDRFVVLRPEQAGP